MRIILQVLAALTAQVSFGQQSSRVPTGPDLDDLYARVSESAYVVKGRVLDYKGVGKRYSLPPRERWDTTARTQNIEDLVGGILFTVSVGEIMCRQSDFAVSASETASPPGVVHVFVPFGEPSVQSRLDRNRHVSSEYLMVGKDYLLFLRGDPRQDELASVYQLDAGLTYYRTYEGDRGAVQLPDAANPERPYTFITPLVSAVTTFCNAVKAPDVETKIRQLNAAKSHSTEPAWHRSVDAAIRAFQQAQTKAPQK